MRDDQYWAVVPAAGVGRRMESKIPKQYLDLAGSPVLIRTIERLASCSGIAGLFLGISAGDQYWQALDYTQPWLKSVFDGGKERSDTVRLILEGMAGMVHEDDWVLVHDAVRPCVRNEDIERLMLQASKQDGGLLALPVTDTLKRANSSREVESTVDRQNLWRAQTPQMFRYADLKQALDEADRHGHIITDEASAMEHAGFHPLLVQGSGENIKITLPGDIQIAESYL
jgi:2-C-methyl-D-erythritol 4-phosphate cytidylyltransferase